MRLLVVLSVILLSGCADYLNHYDGVTLAGGDTQKANRILHAVDPFNPASEDTSIESDGQRTADVVKKYKTSQQGTALPPPVIEPPLE